MRKSVKEPDFFMGKAEDVACNLLGKYIYSKGGKERYMIVETEAYYHDEKYENGKHICYGADKTKAEAKAKKLVTAPLFELPGTWGIYHGQLLLSVTDDIFPDNVLVKKVKNEAGEILGPDLYAKTLHLYKKDPDYCDCRSQYSLSEVSDLYLSDGQEVSNIICSPRVRIADKKNLNFKMDGE